ncbi:hypothetical protein ACN6LA_002499 [Streptomyces sp. SAS_269]|uniref:hypothetical protein n=1 Tax=Streptomyces sp. SAS_269 TaxID=3412749 RepID=UPI00403C5F5C
MKKKRICLVVVACAVLAAACGGGETPVDTSRLTDPQQEWVEFAYAHEKNDETKRAWEGLTAEGVKSYLRRQRPRPCGDSASLMGSLKEAGHTADEMQEYEDRTEELICSHP